MLPERNQPIRQKTGPFREEDILSIFAGTIPTWTEATADNSSHDSFRDSERNLKVKWVNAEVANSPTEGARMAKSLGLAWTSGPTQRVRAPLHLSLIHISEPTRLLSISYAVFCLKKKKKK